MRKDSRSTTLLAIEMSYTRKEPYSQVMGLLRFRVASVCLRETWPLRRAAITATTEPAELAVRQAAVEIF